MSGGDAPRVVGGKYRLDEELGRGGMGAVYRAFHLRVHKVFALKMLLGDIARHRSIASRFQLEAQAAGRIGHPGILDVYDVGEDADGTPFIVMELLRGEPLSALVRRERIDIDAAVWITIEILDVLEAAHKAGIIHRDVKPQNVFLTESTSSPPVRGVKLLDFGIAKFTQATEASALTRSGEIIGSPLYMAPEQAKGEPDIDERVDVWSVGAMLFEMLTGQCAHTASTPVAVLAKILTEPAPPPSTRSPGIGEELDAIVQKALAIDRAARWRSAREMRDALAPLRTTSGVPALPAPVKVSVPPNSGDATPAAITSTVLASTPPGLASTALADAHEPAPATRAETPHAKNEKRPPWPLLLGAGAVVVAAGAYVVAQGSASPPASSAPTSTDPTPSLLAASSTSAADSPAPSSVGSNSSGALDSASAAPSPSHRTGVPAPTSLLGPAQRPPAMTAHLTGADDASAPVLGEGAPKCSATQHLSQGHCCERGLEWQNGHCERPIATTF